MRSGYVTDGGWSGSRAIDKAETALSDDNIIKFRKRPDPKKRPKPGNGRSPHNGKNPHNGHTQHTQQQKGRSMPVPPFVLLFFAAAAIGGVLYVLDQQKPVASSAREAAP